ncbi:MAG: GtrA family protein [Chloroflexota bacterium]|nr:MAG: GtrA family protein [Chloroflexota bacterium]
MAVLILNTRERTRFFRFAVVGAIGAVVDFGTFNILSGLLGIPALIAQSISFIIAVASNFTWNRFWTYPDSRSKSLRRQLLQFFVVNAIGLAIRTPIFGGLETPLRELFERGQAAMHIRPLFSAQFMGHNLALACAVIVVMMWNFFVNRYWTYNDVK